jgi:hypothetical protein
MIIKASHSIFYFKRAKNWIEKSRRLEYEKKKKRRSRFVYCLFFNTFSLFITIKKSYALFSCLYYYHIKILFLIFSYSFYQVCFYVFLLNIFLKDFIYLKYNFIFLVYILSIASAIVYYYYNYYKVM